MSPRAAWRLETLGFAQVYDFAVGKAAWAAMGLPMEGTGAGSARAADAVRQGVLTCVMGDAASDVARSLEGSREQDCIVLNAEGIVMGRSRAKALAANPGAPVEEVMEPGPSTVRPNVPLDGLVGRMRLRGTTSTVVSTLDGKLIGVLYREDAERYLGIENLVSEQP